MKKLEQVSVTEISQFRECRRRWYLGTHLGYERKAERPELWFGDLMHSALQVYAERGVKAAIREWYKRFDESIGDVKKGYGGLWDQAQSMYEEYRDLGAGMLQNYELFVEAMGVEMKTIHLEQRVWVPIREPGTMWKGKSGSKVPKWTAGRPIGVKLTAR